MENTNTKKMFDYFYSDENEQYLFLQMPMMLVKDEQFKKVSSDAKILYSLLLNRTSLSKKNNWKDEYGRVYIIYTIYEISKDLNCCENTAIKSMKELKDIGLIHTKRQGLTLPNLIYVMNFATELKYTPKEKEPSNPYEIRNLKKCGSENAINEVHESQILRSSNTDNSYIDFIKIDSKSMSCQQEQKSEVKTKISDIDDDFIPNHEIVKKQIKENIDYDTYLLNNKKDEIELVDELINCMVDVICTKDNIVKINGEEKSRSLVISQYMQLTSMDIDHIINRYKAQNHKIARLHNYLKTMLFTVKLESNHYYTNQVNADLTPVPPNLLRATS